MTTTLDSATVLTTGLDRFAIVLDTVPEGSWEAPTPCDGWSVLDVVGHVLIGADATTALLEGRDFDWGAAGEPRDRVGPNPVSAFRAAMGDVRSALRAADLDHATDTPMGSLTVAQRIAFPAMDLHVHAWDVGHAVGRDVELEPEVIAFSHSVLDPIPEEMSRSARVFGPQVAVPAGATPTEEFLAWTGRNPR